MKKYNIYINIYIKYKKSKYLVEDEKNNIKIFKKEKMKNNTICCEKKKIKNKKTKYVEKN